MKSMTRQHGITLISWLVILMVIGFFITLGLRLAPIYMQFYTVKSVVTALPEEPLIGRKTVGEIRSMLDKRLEMNGIEFLKRDDIKISRSKGVTTVVVRYEARKPMVANVDIVVSFNESVTLNAN